jgi:flagellar hook-basal body complex protein FliE
MEIAKIDALQGPLAASAATAAAKTGATAGAGGFLEMLTRSLDQVNQAQGQADSLAKQFLSGQNGVGLEDAMISMQKANITFQTAVQVRNKLVAAYHDIMNMPV